MPPVSPNFSLVSAGWRELHQRATPIATSALQVLPVLPDSFFCRPAEQVAPSIEFYRYEVRFDLIKS